MSHSKFHTMIFKALLAEKCTEGFWFCRCVTGGGDQVGSLKLLVHYCRT